MGWCHHNRNLQGYITTFEGNAMVLTVWNKSDSKMGKGLMKSCCKRIKLDVKGTNNTLVARKGIIKWLMLRIQLVCGELGYLSYFRTLT